MPLIKRCSMAAFKANFKKERAAGKSFAQAFAIAVSTLRQACKKEGKPMPKGLPKKEK